MIEPTRHAKNIRDELVERRRARLAATGPEEGAAVPAMRESPIVPFLGKNGLICEVKRRSPSRGAIDQTLDPVLQAGKYVASGAGNISVLTIPEGFGGNLDDMMRIKKAHPDVAVLRKDFLFDIEDVDVAYRAGADAVLLIAGMLPAGTLAAMHARATELGIAALVELHTREDVDKARLFKPALTGVNSRNLETFAIDPLLPLRIKAMVDWETTIIYESGILHPEHAVFAISAGFGGILVGEAVVRSPDMAAGLLAAVQMPRRTRFWNKLISRQSRGRGGPLVKICGLTREKDARLAADLGADVLGFVFWPGSKRRADREVVNAVRDIPLPKVAVAVNGAGMRELDDTVRDLLEAGSLDAVQLHGDELPGDCAALWPDYYKALRPAHRDDAARASGYRCPRVLLDAFDALPGGTGKAVATDVLDSWRSPLWLAGGINSDTIAEIIAIRQPELVDLASGVEASPGVKDADGMRYFFAALEQAVETACVHKENGSE